MAPATMKFERAKLVLHEPVTDGNHFKPGRALTELEFDFNPKEYSTGLQASWEAGTSKKQGANHPQFTATQLQTLDVEVFLDATSDDDGDVSSSVDVLLTTVRPTQKSADANTPCPPLVMFSWGAMVPFLAVVKSVAVSHTLFRPTGAPVRATCKLSMQEYPTDPPRTNPTSGALRSSRAHRVVLGDTLASISTAEYGSPTLWRAIATVNEIDDPFDLRLGRELFIPPADDAAALA